ncbi:MAG: molybdopterin adenylyltransferase [Petroclostridium sp.]|jgi:molybdenum cofactor synthesis domain-containing protein|uniref:MogA/MoaB family molybdenum cofactor biosynthesis protein n=1 Tax=Petroclostridium xylanilyticum TaxID=1792311 RepID=UPI000B9880D1|nr:MogA/MoaB family molybdenum cofactor biosynthesis protein [Petroclostridium xylanilyticum]MBZ4646767.1 Molybdenum cofactor biosynthesis protein [Clostridia bacterium]MDK2809501.1 molybdopterin adenylyltransferase [Petroclostridium sp.]
MFSVGIITASDKGAQGQRVDESGKVIQDILSEKGYIVIRYVVLPDDYEQLSREMIYMADTLKANLILTTGGTGFSERDITPEATKSVIEREVPGVAEAIRAYSLAFTPRAMLSRGVCGIRGKTVILNLPGSPKAVKESLEYVMDSIQHGLEILLGKTAECARQ